MDGIWDKPTVIGSQILSAGTLDGELRGERLEVCELPGVTPIGLPDLLASSGMFSCFSSCISRSRPCLHDKSPTALEQSTPLKLSFEAFELRN